MFVRILMVYMCIHGVSPKVEEVEGVIGASVVLPCSGREDQPSLESIEVYWRHNSNLNVYDINKGKGSAEKQQLEYKNRVETFPEGYLKGNFSLQLNNLRDTDAGTYSCYINKEQSIQKVKLQLKDGIRPNNSTDLSTEKPDMLNKGAQTGPEKIVTTSLLAISILLFV
ncbi:CD276 antigen homolog isoform X2 [Triplophysa dalaica]|uniref:CD276 antigen homolog isoform X2 n=1 Tax=Triplophysa dalaica TaxID=1582913 RepID=UPI0024DFC43B|nr:CD276 antigen homolog isoform X2 [Triplophysa dalaica]